MREHLTEAPRPVRSGHDIDTVCREPVGVVGEDDIRLAAEFVHRLLKQDVGTARR
jgi:hypothetical protein